MAAPKPKEIREAFQDYRSSWEDIREESHADMRALSVQGPWSDEDRAAREDAGRPCIHLDQLNQFLAQIMGNFRKSKRAIKLEPKGNGANDQDAKRRSGIVMSIEEHSQAPGGIYPNVFQDMISRSYAYSVLRTEYRDFSSFDQDIVIKPVINPDTALISPYYKQPNASDIPDGFLLDLVTKKEFRRLYRNAKVTDFSDEQMDQPHATDWIKEKYVQRGEYWKVEYDLSKLLLVRLPGGELTVLREDELQAMRQHMRGPGGKFIKFEVAREREIQQPYVMQYMTNGLEILDEIEWMGSRIPIISCLGPERWRTEGGNAKRELLSMVRFARDPQMLYDFLATQECEEAGQIPKSPFVGAKGQFESDWERWENVTKIPAAFLQYDVVIDQANQTPLPPPTRPQWQPNFQQFELAKDAATRAVQAGMNISPLPDAAQRRNQKSGIALERIDDMESLGSFVFIDRFESGYLHNLGWQINELITPILDTEREIPIAQPDGKRVMMKLVGNTSHPIDESGAYEVQSLQDEQGNTPEHVHTGKGEFDVTISSGPSHDSERDEQADFADELLGNAPQLAPIIQPGTPWAKILALAIRMRPTLGPVGEQIAAIFDPPQTNNLPPQAQALVQQLQAEIQQLQQENSALHLERAGKILELQNKQTIEAMKGKHILDKATMDLVTKIVVAALQKGSQMDAAEAQAIAERELAVLGFQADHIDRGHQAAHEAGMQAVDQAHERQQSANQLAIAQANAAAAQNQSQAGQPGSAG